MRMSPPLVVAGWGALNVALAAMLAGFGERPAAIALYSSVAALVMIIASLVRAGVRRGGRPRRREPNGDSTLLLACGILVAGLGLAFAWYLALLGLPFLVAAALRESTARREET